MCYVKTMGFSSCPRWLCLYLFKHVATSLLLVLCDCVSVLWWCLSPACLSPRCSSNQWFSWSQQCQWHSHLQRWALPQLLLNAFCKYEAFPGFGFLYLCRSFPLACVLCYFVSCQFSVHTKPFVCGQFMTAFTACISPIAPDNWKISGFINFLSLCLQT